MSQWDGIDHAAKRGRATGWNEFHRPLEPRPREVRHVERLRHGDDRAMQETRRPLAHTTDPEEAPLSVRFEDQNATEYLVRVGADDERVRVPKQRAAVAPYPPARAKRSADMRLLRWSSFALLGVVFGGLGGAIIGPLTATIALLLLIWHDGRVRRWRLASEGRRGRDSVPPLPDAASAERARLRTALWQSLLASILGMVVLLALLHRLP